ncbi:MAG: ABC transporter ATP-binding protein [Cellvibrionaceae bacterium]|nr:ABC transporter ATP-binding protein [Cellvibrionaceae bacterium]
MQSDSHEVGTDFVRSLVKEIIIPETGFFKVAIAYGIAISLLTLAVPIAVQMLINSVVNTASVSAVVTLATLLFATLSLSGLFSALRTHIMERYERHIYARLTAEISVRTLMADNAYFEGRRNVDITNRFFDIGTFQKNIPPLVIDGFALCLQTLVGTALVSFYHPVFFVFSLIFILTLVCIWLIWGNGAVRTAVQLSRAKYTTAKWLGDLSAAHTFFKSSQQIRYAGERTNSTARDYVAAHQSHFHYTFRQTIALLLLYALASSALLGIGGVLVIRGELSIGQLVAAELILTTIFFGLSQASSYLKVFYELCGAAEELSQVLSLPLEKQLNGKRHLDSASSTLEFHQAELDIGYGKLHMHNTVASGIKCFVVTRHPWLQRAIIKLLKSDMEPQRGWIKLGGRDLRDLNVQTLRQAVAVIDRSLIIECSLQYFLTMSAPGCEVSDMESALATVGLSEAVERLPKGLGTLMSPLGAPFLPHEFLLLKLAAALLSQPKVVILTQYFDNMPLDDLKTLLERLEKQAFTVLYFSNHPDISVFDYCLCLDWQLQLGNA